MGLLSPSVNALSQNSTPVTAEKQNVIAFVGGAGLNIARIFRELPDVQTLFETTHLKTLVIGDFTYSNNQSQLPPSDYQFLLSESFAYKRFHPLNVFTLKNYPINQQMAMAKKELEALRMTMRNSYKSLTVVAALGGQTGTFAGAALAEIALEESIPTSRILITPFTFEYARTGLAVEVFVKTNRESFRDRLLHNQDALTELGSNTLVPVAFDYLNKRAAMTALGNINTIYQPV